jgi:DNA-binding CsgD family transcriptional regulator
VVCRASWLDSATDTPAIASGDSLARSFDPEYGSGVLLGRQAERARIEGLLDDARKGRGGALVIRGEPGIGKTSLLRYALDLAEAMTVVRAVGVESEAGLEYSALVEVCRPLLTGLEGLPDHQAENLRAALGLSGEHPGDRFAVGAAMLGLLALVAESRPLLVIVDDGQWIDTASADALAFAARRIHADAVAVLVATRSGSRAFSGGFDELVIEGLDEESSSRLLGQVAGSSVPPEVAARLWSATGGNPLALVELPRVLNVDQLAGAAEIEEPVPVGAGVQESYSRSVEHLPEATQGALVVLAVSSSGNLELVAAVLAGLGGVEALEPAEDAGLLELRADAYVFRHPLVRSAVVQAAAPSARREAHRMVAEALAARGDQDGSAWHLAAASLGPDDAVADALAATAARSRDRGGHEAAAKAYEQAARLTRDTALRCDRLAHAAEAAWNAGDSEQANALADEVLAATDDAGLRARLLRLRGRMELQTGSSSEARQLFLESASLFGPDETEETVNTLGLSIFACHFEGRIEESVELSRRARELAPHDGSTPDLHADYLLGRSLLLAGKPEAGAPQLERVLAGLLDSGNLSRLELTRASTLSTVLERGREATEQVREATRLGREAGPMALVYCLNLTGELCARHGLWAEAVAAATEGLALARELDQGNIVAHFLLSLARVEAGRGNEAACRASATEAQELLVPAGMALPALHVSCSLGLLDLGLGRLEEAVATLDRASRQVGEMGLCDRDVMPEPDLVEGLVALGRREDAVRALDGWLERGAEDGTLLGAALVTWSRGLVAPDDAFEAPLREALELHDRTGDPFARARTRLSLGERLRRSGRRVDARPELRAALEVFQELAAEPWIRRTRRELRATGEKLGRRAARTGDELTAQELQVALQVAEGKTNREAGAVLFLSPKTVEFHLARVYRKLEISSRAELVRRFALTPVAVES